MNYLFNYILEFSICLGIALLFYKLILSKVTHYEWNRWALMTFLIASFSFPLLSLDFSATASTAVNTVTLPVVWVGESMSKAVLPGVEKVNYLALYLGLIYASGCFYFLIRLLIGFYKVFQMIQVGERIRYMGFEIITSPDFQPCSFFRYILLPSFDSSNELDHQIFLHESVHVRRSHSFDLLLIQLAKVVFWFNPLIYVFEKQVRELHEFEADAEVSKNFSVKKYSELLLDQLAKDAGLILAHPFNQFQTKKRIVMMNSPKSGNWEKLRFLLSLPLLGLMFFVFSCNLTPDEELEGPTQMGEKAISMSPSNALTRAKTLGANGEEIFDVVETQPNPPGGMEGWNSYLATNLNYPSEAREMGIEGTVIVVFVINADGSISNVDILRGVGGGCDEEAIRVVENSPNWKPGMQRGRVVNTRMRMPIRFKLSEESKL